MKKLLLLATLFYGHIHAMEKPLTETEKPFGDFDKYADLRDAALEPEAVITAKHPLKKKLTTLSAVQMLKKAQILKPNFPVNTVAFDPHTPHVSVSAGGHCTCYLREGNSARYVCGPHQVMSIAYDPCRSGQCALGTNDRTIAIWDLNENAENKKKLIVTLSGHEDIVTSIAYNPYHPDQLASGSRDKTIKIWDFKASKQLAQLKGHGTVESIAYDPHNRARLASGSNDTTIIIWDLKDLNAVKQLAQLKGHEGSAVTSIAYDPHNRDRLASGGAADKTIVIWDLATFQKLTQLKGHENSITSLAYDPHHAGQLASGSADKTIIIWDLAISQLLTQLKGHEQNITSVAYDPHHSGHLASGSLDKTTIMWDVNALHTIIEWFNKGCKISAAAPSNDNNDSTAVSMSKVKLLLDEMAYALENGGYIALDAEKIAIMRSMPQEVRDILKITDLII